MNRFATSMGHGSTAPRLLPVEMLLCVILGAVVISAGMQVAWRNGACVEGDAWGKPNVAMRAAVDQLHRQVRLASLPSPYVGPLLLTRNSNPDTLILLNAQVGPGLTTDRPLSATDQFVSTVETPYAVASGSYALLISPDGTRRLPIRITYINLAERLLNSEFPLGQSFPRGSRLVPVSHVTYAIDRTDPDRPDLVAVAGSGERRIIATQISDFQVFWRLPSGVYADNRADTITGAELWVRLSAVPDNDENYSWATALAVRS